MVLDYKADVAAIIGDWDTLLTQKRLSLTYNDRGEAVKGTETTVTTANMDIQPVDERLMGTMMELGDKELYTHILYGYYDISGTALSVVIGDRFYDASNKLYEVKYVRNYENSHLEIYCIFVQGKI